jgi:MFS family permease
VVGAATSVAEIISLLLFGWMADTWSRKAILITGQCVIALGGLLYGMAATIGSGPTAIWMIFFARTLIGFGTGEQVMK